jgi:hypothetical protein
MVLAALSAVAGSALVPAVGAPRYLDRERSPKAATVL